LVSRRLGWTLLFGWVFGCHGQVAAPPISADGSRVLRDSMSVAITATREGDENRARMAASITNHTSKALCVPGFDFQVPGGTYIVRYLLFAPFCASFDAGYPSINVARSFHSSVFGAAGALERWLERLGPGVGGAIFDSGEVTFLFASNSSRDGLPPPRRNRAR
jgi:hypothetical protein